MVTTAELQRRGLPYAVVVDGAATPASLADLDDKGLPYLVEVADGATMASRRALEGRGLRYLVPVLVDATAASKASLAAQGLRYAVQVDADILPVDRAVLQRQGLACYVEVDSSGNSVSAAAVGGAALLVGEANGFAADFTHPVDAERVAVKTAGTVVSSGTSFFTSSGTSSKWVYNAAGVLVNIPVGTLALDYDPVTHVCKGLLIEPVATNLILGSQDLSFLTIDQGSLVNNNQTGPDGALTADTFTESTAVGTQGYYAGGAYTANIDYTVSRYYKMGTRRYATVGWADGTNGAYAVYDLQAGTVGSSAAFGTGVLNSASIQAAGNGWYRCILSAKVNATTMYTTFCAANAATITADTYGRQSFVGTGATLIFGHAQVETGTVATSPIPTTGAQVTRAADNISFLLSAIPAIGASFTLYGRWQTPSIASNRFAYCVTDNLGTPGDYAGLGAFGTARLTVADGTVTQCTIVAGTPVANTSLSIAGRVAANDFSVSMNGAAVVTDVSGTQPVVTHVRFGNTGGNAAATAQFYVEKMVILPRGMSNAELVVRSVA